jgi:hypothetical protein
MGDYIATKQFASSVAEAERLVAARRASPDPHILATFLATTSDMERRHSGMAPNPKQAYGNKKVPLHRVPPVLLVLLVPQARPVQPEQRALRGLPDLPARTRARSGCSRPAAPAA